MPAAIPSLCVLNVERLPWQILAHQENIRGGRTKSVAEEACLWLFAAAQRPSDNQEERKAGEMTVGDTTHLRNQSKGEASIQGKEPRV
jgi:hypothetical protein